MVGDTVEDDSDLAPQAKAALLEERAGGSQQVPVFHFDLRPYAFQQEILDPSFR